MRQKSRAIALISTLLLMVVLVVMTLALIRLAREQALAADAYQSRRAAQFAAEAGMAYVLAELSADRNWDAGFDQKPTRWGNGSFSVHFGNPAGPYQEGTSVNNFSDAAAWGPAGPATVPPQTAFVMVKGFSRGHEVTIEAIVGDRELTEVRSPVLAETSIAFAGPTQILGLESLDGEGVDVRVHSNRPENLGIQWLGPVGNLQVNGDLSTSSDSVGAINLEAGSSPHDHGALLTDADRVEPPKIDVAGTVAANSSGDSLTFTLGLNTVPAGKYHITGTEIHGDLVLQDGVELYVNGNLKVNGSISGQGTVVVAGDAELYGHSSIASNNQLALLASGDIELKGFDGTAWLHNVPGATPVMAQIDTTIRELITQLDSGATSVPLQDNISIEGGHTPRENMWGQMGVMDRLNHQIHYTMLPEPMPDIPDYSPGVAANLSAPVFHSGMHRGRVRHLHRLVAEESPSPTQEFLIKKMRALDRFVQGAGDEEEQLQKLADFRENPGMDTPGVWAALADRYLDLEPHEREAAKSALKNIMNEFTMDRMGQAFFDGFLYAEGSFKAHSEVTIMGSVVSAGGEISTHDSSRVIFMEDYFSPGDGALRLRGQMAVRAWSVR